MSIEQKKEFECYLIDAVKKYPVLYDRNAVGYNNKDDVENAWLEVTKDVKKNINNINVNHCKLRWRTLRDRFVKQIAKTPDGVEHFTPEAKRWEYTSRLAFIRPFLQKRKCDEDYDPCRATTTTTRKIKKVSNTQAKSQNRPAKSFSFVTIEAKSLRVTPDSSRSQYVSEDEYQETLESEEEEQEIEMPDPMSSSSPKRQRFEAPEFLLDCEEIDESAVMSSNETSKLKLNVNEDTLNKLLKTTNELLQQQLKQNTQKSPNDAYFKVLDSYFAKLPSNEVDRVKVEILNLILAKRSSLIQRHKMGI